MRFGEIKGRAIVSVADANKLGTVSSAWLDGNAQRVLALSVKGGGLFASHQAVLLEELQSLGEDAITVADATRLNEKSKFPALQGAIDLETLAQSRILTESGKVLGSFGDIDLELPSGEVVAYLLANNLLERLKGKEHPIPIADVRSVGEKLIVVADSHAEAGE